MLLQVIEIHTIWFQIDRYRFYLKQNILKTFPTSWDLLASFSISAQLERRLKKQPTTKKDLLPTFQPNSKTILASMWLQPPFNLLIVIIYECQLNHHYLYLLQELHESARKIVFKLMHVEQSNLSYLEALVNTGIRKLHEDNVLHVGYLHSFGHNVTRDLKMKKKSISNFWESFDPTGVLGKKRERLFNIKDKLILTVILIISFYRHFYILAQMTFPWLSNVGVKLMNVGFSTKIYCSGLKKWVSKESNPSLDPLFTQRSSLCTQTV